MRMRLEGASSIGGLLDEAGDAHDVFGVGGLDGGDAVAGDLVVGDLDERQDDAAGLGLEVDHAGQELVVEVAPFVAEEDGERLVADVGGGAADGVAEALGAALADGGHLGDRLGGLDLREHRVLALGLEGVVEVGAGVEVVDHGVFAWGGDEGDVVGAGGGGLLHDVLEDRLVDDRQELLGDGLGDRQEAGGEPCRGNDGFRGAGRGF